MDGNNNAGHQYIRKFADDAVRLVLAIPDKQRLNAQHDKPSGKQQPMDMLNGGNLIECWKKPEIGFEKA
ncbi:MAG: hypothetical protein ABI203_01240 [Mucilaginibacter sp.]